MKKFVRILFAVVIAALLTGCSGGGSKFTVTGGGVQSVHVGNPITAVAELTINNPSYKVQVSDVSGVVKKGEDALLNLKAEDFTIPARTESTVFVPVEASLAPDVGLLRIMSIMGGGNFEGLTVDLTFTGTGFLGLKKTQTFTDIPIKDIIGLL